MNDTLSFQISIPCDDDGYVLLRCEHCGDMFKAPSSDIEDESLLYIYCPGCGLVSDSYLTPDVLELATTIAQNYATDIVYNAFKDMEKKTRNSILQVKAGKKPRHKDERPIKSGIEALTITSFACCNRSAKIKPLLRLTGCYCPFCGVKNYEIE